MIEIKSINLTNDEVLAYRERAGGSKLLVLVHGNMSSSLHWDLLMERINENYKIYAVDLRGFGESTYYNPVNSINDFSEDLKLFCDALGLKEFHLMGWSTGGCIAMQFTANHPEYVNKLVLIDSVGTRGYPIYKKDNNGQAILNELVSSYEEIAQDPVKILPVLKAYANKDKSTMKLIWNNLIYNYNKPAPEKYDLYLEEMFKQRNLVDVYYSLANFNISKEYNDIKEGTGDAAKINRPTLVLQGKNDLVVSEKIAQNIKNDIGQNAKLVYLAGCGHSPMTDDLEQLLKVVSEFLEE